MDGEDGSRRASGQGRTPASGGGGAASETPALPDMPLRGSEVDANGEAHRRLEQTLRVLGAVRLILRQLRDRMLKGKTDGIS